MIDPPKRTGYRLTYDAECLYNDWQEIGGCTCFLGCAPCSSCCAEGHPISLEENDEAWELDYTITDVYNAWKLKQEKESMSRTEITDKGGTQPKSEWFGFKYRVNPETSKLLQEAVFKDGGKWSASKTGVQLVDHPYLFVKVDGVLSYCSYDGGSYFERHHLPEKQPPQPVKVEPTSKDFVAGKWYKCLRGEDLATSKDLKSGKWYKVVRTDPEGDDEYIIIFESELRGNQEWWKSRFDINSESDCDPTKEKLDTEVKESKIVTYQAEDVKVFLNGTEIQCSKLDNFSITKEDVDMTNVTRRVVNVKFFDEDAGLDVADSLVAFYDNVVTQDSDESTVRELLMNLDVAAKIEAHNKVRAKTVDLEILRNTGNEVTLRPIKLKDLRIEVTKA